jgi:hypothetical protein
VQAFPRWRRRAEEGGGERGGCLPAPSAHRPAAQPNPLPQPHPPTPARSFLILHARTLLVGALALLVAKTALVSCVVKAFGHPWRTSVLVGWGPVHGGIYYFYCYYYVDQTGLAPCLNPMLKPQGLLRPQAQGAGAHASAPAPRHAVACHASTAQHCRARRPRTTPCHTTPHHTTPHHTTPHHTKPHHTTPHHTTPHHTTPHHTTPHRTATPRQTTPHHTTPHHTTPHHTTPHHTMAPMPDHPKTTPPRPRPGEQVGLTLAHVGEFSFILLAESNSLKVLPPQVRCGAAAALALACMPVGGQSQWGGEGGGGQPAVGGPAARSQGWCPDSRRRLRLTRHLPTHHTEQPTASCMGLLLGALSCAVAKRHHSSFAHARPRMRLCLAPPRPRCRASCGLSALPYALNCPPARPPPP